MDTMYLCWPLKEGFEDLERRDDVPAEFYEEGKLEHPAVPGLMLSLKERLYGGYLGIWEASTGKVRDETMREKPFRIQWKKPIVRSQSRTDKDHVLPDMDLFKNDRQKKIEREKEKAKTTYSLAEAVAFIENAALEDRVKLNREAEARRVSEKKAAEDAQEHAAAEKNRLGKLQSKTREKHLQMLAKHLEPELESIKQAGNSGNESNLQTAELEKKLAGVVAQLQKMYLDIDSGLSIGDIGFSNDQDFQDAVDDLVNEIAKLKGLIQTLKIINKGIER